MTLIDVPQPAPAADCPSTRVGPLNARPLFDAIAVVARRLGCERFCAVSPSPVGELVIYDGVRSNAHGDLRLGMPLLRLLAALPGRDCLLIDTALRRAWSCTARDACLALRPPDDAATASTSVPPRA